MRNRYEGKNAPRRGAIAGAVAALTLSAAFDAAAYRWDFDNGVVLNFDSTVSYGVRVRTAERYSALIGRDNGGTVPTTGDIGELLHGPGGGVAANPDFNFLNGDNGNLNYDQWDVTNAVLKGTHELGIKWGDGWEFLGRMFWLYDHQVNDVNFQGLSDQAKDLAQLNLTPLDLWVSKDFEVFGQPAKIRLGNQVVSWGEDIFIIGGINSVNALDILRFRTPGTQIKEVLRPAPMFYFNVGVTDGLTVEGYYQFIWNDFRFDPVGTFLSGADVVGKGQLDAFAPASFGLCGGLPCGDGNLAPVLPGANVVPKVRTDLDPETTGQFGLALRYVPESFEADFGLYFVHYHDKIPFTSFVFDPQLSSLINPASQGNLLGLGYFNEYGEDRNLFGLSANTKIGPVAVGTEFSYRPKDSVAIDPTVPIGQALATGFGFPFQGLAPGTNGMSHSIMDAVGCALTGDQVTAGPDKSVDLTTCAGYTRGYVEEEKYQAHLTGFYFIEIDSVFGRMMRSIGAAEGYVLAEIAVAHYPSLDPRNVPYLIFPSYDVPDKTSAGYALEFGLTYPNLLFDFNVSPQFNFYHDFEGTTPNALPFVEGRKAVFLGLNFDMQSVWRGQIGYTNYFGGGYSNIIRDRDFLGANVSFSF